MDYVKDDLFFRKFTADKVRLTCAVGIDKTAAAQRAEFHTHEVAYTNDKLFMHLDTYIHGMPGEMVSVHEKWPADWWEAVKERWLPAWALKRWPVQYKRIDVEKQLYAAVCPHIQDEPQRQHLEWMAYQFDAAKFR